MAIMIFLSFVAAVFMLPALLFQFGNLEGDRPLLLQSKFENIKESEPVLEKKRKLLKKIKKKRNPDIL
jgi:hypothetical protein